ncbi:MAG TPA: hypothetical protein VES67_07140 [Vicinamibacterales bacterium]|nr:hypothetical protein [Vicinamibacterales bacterium]
MNDTRTWTSDAVLASLRRFLLILLLIGLAGVGAELIALAHYEDSWQLVPLALIALAFLVIGWHVVDGSAATVRVFRIVMVMFIVAGVTGIVLHYRGNLEFQLEIDPSQDHWTLFGKVIRAKAPPALAPGTMAQLGLLGLAYAFRHPALGRR